MVDSDCSLNILYVKKLFLTNNSDLKNFIVFYDLAQSLLG